MSTMTLDYEKGSKVDGKIAEDMSNGLTVTIAEDTVEAAHQCTSRPFPNFTANTAINMKFSL
jgi:hypothetical protein